jgi:hypothetical protein
MIRLNRCTGFAGAGTLAAMVTAVLMPVWAGAQPAGRQVPPAVSTYSVSTLAPARVTVPPIILADADLHALLVELASGIGIEEAGRRLGLSGERLTQLIGLAEVSMLGRQRPGGLWQPLAPALDESGVARMASLADSLGEAIADSVAAHWPRLVEEVAHLPVAGRLPLEQSGFVLIGGYLLGRYQAEWFWQAGLAPADRPYAFRVYRMPAGTGPAGNLGDPAGADGWGLTRYARTAEPFGFALLADPEHPFFSTLLDSVGAEEAGQVANELRLAYRTWYLLGIAPDGLTRRLLTRLEGVDEQGRLRVPLVTPSDEEGMRSLAGLLGEALWPRLRRHLPQIGELAIALGYGEPERLGEIALWTWEMAVDRAMSRLIEQGLILEPVAGRGQALVVSEH